MTNPLLIYFCAHWEYDWFVITDADAISVESVEDEDNPFTFYNIAKFVLLPKIVSKKSFDVGALADPKRNTLHDVLEVKKTKLKQESKAAEEQGKKYEKGKETNKEKTKDKPKHTKQKSQEPKPGNKNRRNSRKGKWL